MKLPFFLTIKGVKLSGKEYNIEKIKYYGKDDYDTEMKCLDVEYDSVHLKELNEYKVKKLEIELKHNIIDVYEFDKKMIDIHSKEWSVEDKELKLLDIELKHNKIDNIEYDKRKHDIQGKPWAVFKMKYDEDTDPSNMQTEVLYNEYFVKHLMNMGFSGKTEYDIVNSWLGQMFAANIDDNDLVMNSDYHKMDNSTIIMG
jgi:hypothetical protein